MVRVWTLFYYCSIISDEGASIVLKQKNGKKGLYPKTTLRFTWKDGVDHEQGRWVRGHCSISVRVDRNLVIGCLEH